MMEGNCTELSAYISCKYRSWEMSIDAIERRGPTLSFYPLSLHGQLNRCLFWSHLAHDLITREESSNQYEIYIPRAEYSTVQAMRSSRGDGAGQALMDSTCTNPDPPT